MFASRCLRSLVLALPLTFIACADEKTFVPIENNDALPASPNDGGASSDTVIAPIIPSDAMADGGTGDTAAVPQPTTQGIVVVHSDYQSTSVSLLTTAGNLRLDDCIHSGSVSAKLTLALSGDVVLPSSPSATGEVLLIDRQSATLTFLNPVDCSVDRQLNIGTGFAANPYDVVVVSNTTAYATRYAPQASDVLVFNPTTGATITRIDLLPSAIPGAAAAATLPRPDQALLFEGKLYVSLNNFSADFMAAGTGRVAIIDPTTNQIEGNIDLPTLKNCSSLRAAGPQTLVVACGGSFSDGAAQINHAGIARLNTQTRTVASILASTTFGTRTVSHSSLAVAGDRIFATTNGNFGAPPPDQLWTATFTGEAPMSILSAQESFVLGTALIDLATGRLLVSNAAAATPRIFVLNVATAPTVQALGNINSGPKRGLPPRHMAWF